MDDLDFSAFGGPDDEPEGEARPAKRAFEAPPPTVAVGPVSKKLRPEIDDALAGAAPKAAAAKASPALGLPAARDDAAKNPNDAEPPQFNELSKACRHEVAMPAGQEPDAGMLALDMPEGTIPAKEYKFELDPFQKAAVACIERDESVLVSAHTSAGKTVVAEYAIAKSLQAGQRVLYTSPIKALSNQKYKDLNEVFGDVGLMTGDVTIDVDKSCLVMTTEILRSMLYRGSEVMREVKWVVFDEVHYMRDKERGVVWEEVMILLPKEVRYVFLSATIPNALEFAEWIASLHIQPCHVVYTGYRPTPLMHYIFPQGGTGIYNVVDEQARFKSDQFTKAISAIKAKPHVVKVDQPGKSGRGGPGNGGKGGGGGGKGGGKGGEASDCLKLVNLVTQKQCEPLIVFAFGKKKCEKLAREMEALPPLNTPQEAEMVETVFQNAIQTLSEDDQTLPQVDGMLPMLKRGVAVHHSGLLPTLKELVEILFAENLVKLLFATETFAMGLNMPARTVIFNELSKFDGKETRYLSSGEYIQMSGRAGRRGLDTRGLVVQMVSEKDDSAKLREMLTGAADTLSSRFHLGYNMLLNCVRVETVDVEMLIRKSFYTFQQQKQLPELREREKAIKDRLSSVDLALEAPDLVAELHAALFSEATVQDELRDVLNEPVHALPFLQPGRLVKIRTPPPDSGEYAKGAPLPPEWRWGVVVTYKRVKGGEGDETMRKAMGKKAAKKAAKQAAAAGGGFGGGTADYDVDVLLRCKAGTTEAIARGEDALPSGCRAADEEEQDAAAAPAPMAVAAVEDEEEEEMHVLSIPLSHVDRLSAVKLRLPDDLRPNDAKHSLLKVLKEIATRFPDGLPLLHPFKEVQLESGEEIAKRAISRLDELRARLSEPRLADPLVRAGVPILRRRLVLQAQERTLQSSIQEVEAVLMSDELKARRKVLRKLGHLSDEGVISNKGRVACELSTADELLTTELVFSGADGDDDEALLSIKTVEMRPHFLKLRECARLVASSIEGCRLPIDVKEFVEGFSNELVDVVVMWCNGAKFAEVVKACEWFEGSIIRTFHRLEELLRQLIDAARVVGNEELEERCAAARKLLVRDVIFAASLYT